MTIASAAVTNADVMCEAVISHRQSLPPVHLDQLMLEDSHEMVQKQMVAASGMKPLVTEPPLSSATVAVVVSDAVVAAMCS